MPYNCYRGAMGMMAQIGLSSNEPASSAQASSLPASKQALRPLSIVFLCEQYPPVVWDGAGTYTHDVAQSLTKLGHEVHVVCCQGRRSSDEVDGHVQVHRRPLLRVPVSRLLGRYGHLVAGRDYPRDSLTLRLSLMVSYAWWLRRLGLVPDVVETQDGETRALLIAWRHSMPLVIHLHSPTMLDLRLAGRLRWKGRLADRLDRISSDRADMLSSPSPLLVDTLRRLGWLAGRTPTVIPNPIAAAPWAGAGPVADTRPVILAVGRLEWHKGIDVLLEAAAELLAHGTETELVLAGSSAGHIQGQPAERWLERRARDLGLRCRFTGPVSQERLLELYTEARVVAIPSRFESFSIVALEAMAAGRPVVCTDRTGVAPYIQRAEAGTVVPVDDARALAAALKPFLTSTALATAAGLHALHAVAEFDPQVLARRRTDLYRAAIEAWHEQSKDEHSCCRGSGWARPHLSRVGGWRGGVDRR